MFKVILFPIYQSKGKFEATYKAIQLVKNRQNQIIMLSVVSSHHPVKAPELTTSQLNRAQEKIREENNTCDVIKRQGKPSFVICDVADDFNVDLIVIGTQGMNLEKEYKSTAAQVIQLAPCPVLVVP